MLGFNTLENRYIFKGQLNINSALHIGSGAPNPLTDSPFVKSDGHYFIPGSSIRGAMRSHLERVSPAFGIKTCQLSASTNVKCITVNKMTQKAFDQEMERGIPEFDLFKWLMKNDRLCDTCLLFGSPYYSSKIKLPDMFLTTASSPEGIIRNGVAIDRDTGTAKEGALFDIEVLNKGIKFEFELIAENLEKNDFALLALVLKELSSGQIQIGAKTAIGMGKCSLTLATIKYFDNKTPFGLENYFVTGDYTNLPDPSSFLNNKLKPLIEEIN